MINIVSIAKGIFSLLDTNKYTGEIMIYMRFFFFNVKNKLDSGTTPCAIPHQSYRSRPKNQQFEIS